GGAGGAGGGGAGGGVATAPASPGELRQTAWLGCSRPPACQAAELVITANTAPAGSMSIANRPTPGTSVAGTITLPPCCAAAATVASQSATSKYTRQDVVAPPAAMSGVSGIIPPWALSSPPPAGLITV